jgi:hypothetical protein
MLASSEPLLRSLRRFDGDLVEHRRRRHGPTPSTNPSTPLISISLFNRGTGKYGIVDRHRGLWSHATQTRAAPPARPPPSTLTSPQHTSYSDHGSSSRGQVFGAPASQLDLGRKQVERTVISVSFPKFSHFSGRPQNFRVKTRVVKFLEANRGALDSLCHLRASTLIKARMSQARIPVLRVIEIITARVPS